VGKEIVAMGILKDKVDAARAFFGEVGAETRKCVWPERQELIESTVVVIVSVFLLSLFVGVSDKFLLWLLSLLFPS
jgi:preprotein translocase subunit SecE